MLNFVMDQTRLHNAKDNPLAAYLNEYYKYINIKSVSDNATCKAML